MAPAATATASRATRWKPGSVNVTSREPGGNAVIVNEAVPSVTAGHGWRPERSRRSGWKRKNETRRVREGAGQYRILRGSHFGRDQGQQND